MISGVSSYVTTAEDIDGLRKKRLCHGCVGEDFLKREVAADGLVRKCSYCGSRLRSYAIGDLADRIETVFGEHYRMTSDQPDSMQATVLSDPESDYDWEREGEPAVYAIMNAADIPEEAAQDIQTILGERHDDFEAAKMGEETPFSSDAYYAEKGASAEEWHEAWEAFERSLKNEARFFSRSAAAHLASVFEGLDLMRSRAGLPLIAPGGPGTARDALYRARVFQNGERLMEALCRPDRHLAAPPAVSAAAGRMNARGISVFYGASDPRTALAEVRPPVGSQVAVARFVILAPVRLLDLAVLRQVGSGGSVFDPTLGSRLRREMFLRTLSARMTRPVMPDDEAFEYLVTQAIADFLATETVAPVDGIVFPSVQTAGSGVNVVLFHKVARTEELPLPPGTVVDAQSGQWEEDGFETDYHVFEEVPPEAAAGELRGRGGQDDLYGGPWHSATADHREPALRIDPTSLEVHCVTGVDFVTERHDVRRTRMTRRRLGKS